MKLIYKTIMIILASVIAFGLKYHYSHADSNDLDWILKPTAWLVEITGPMDFEKVENAGYVNDENSITIAPECSGVNYMIILFCLSIFAASKRIKNIKEMLTWTALCISTAFVWTLMVNTARIHLSIYSFKKELFQEWYSRETVHLAEGVLVYFISLIIYHFLMNRIMNTDRNITVEGRFRQLRTGFIPLFFYLTFTLFVPLINYRGIPLHKGFIDYAAIILITCPIVLAVFYSAGACCHYFAVRVKCRRHAQGVEQGA